MATNTQEVHGKKSTVKENVGQHEMELTQPLIHRPPKKLGEPKKDRGKQREDDSGNNVVEVGNDEIRIMDVDVHGRGRHEDTAQPTNDEVRDKSQGEQHRYGEVDRATPKRSQPVEGLDRRRNGDDHGRHHESRAQEGIHADDENMMDSNELRVKDDGGHGKKHVGI